MKRCLFTVLLAIASIAAVYAPAAAQTGIESQPLPPMVDTSSPAALAPSITMPMQSLPVSPNEGPEERALDQSLGLATPAPPKSESAIEAQINAAATHRKTVATSTPASASSSMQSSPAYSYSPQTPPVSSSSSRWEGPEERALDRDLSAIQSGQTPAIMDGTPGPAADPESSEVRRLNGGQ